MSEAYYNTKASVEEYIKLAKDVDGSDLILKLKQFLPTTASLLEIGSGPGSDWNILQRDFKVVGSDNSQEFLIHLNTNYPSGKFLKLDAISLRTEEKFDGIYSNKVLHHLKNQELHDSIKRQHTILNSKGIICHTFWEGESTEVFKGLFINYHTQKELKDLFGKYFSLLLMQSYTEFETADSILFIGQKK